MRQSLRRLRASYPRNFTVKVSLITKENLLEANKLPTARAYVQLKLKANSRPSECFNRSERICSYEVRQIRSLISNDDIHSAMGNSVNAGEKSLKVERLDRLLERNFARAKSTEYTAEQATCARYVVPLYFLRSHQKPHCGRSRDCPQITD